MGRLQLLPKIFKTVLRPIWWVVGTEQPSPPLHRATAAQLLSWSGALQLLFFGTSISWTKSSCISHWVNHISAGGWPMHCSWFLPTPIALCSYPLVKMEIRDSIQILTTAPIFLQSNYFRQKYLEIASCSDSLLIYIWVRVDHSPQHQ